MEKVTFTKEEYDTTPEAIRELEQLLGEKLPADYFNFLLKYNGCVLSPNIPVIEAETDFHLDPIARFLSVGDLMLQRQFPMNYDNDEYHREYDGDKYDIDLNKLVSIAMAEIGTYMIYLGKEDHGRLYFSSYSDWNGLVKLSTRSFDVFLASLTKPEWADQQVPVSPHKVFYEEFFHTQGSDAGLEHFKKVLEFYGEPDEENVPFGNVVQNYVDNRPFLDYMIGTGAKTDGLLNYTRKYKTIHYLTKELLLDINQPYKDQYPLVYFTGAASMNDHMISYHLIHQLLAGGYQLDFSVKDEKGNTVRDRLKNIVEGYLKYRNHELEIYGKAISTAMTSELIDKIVS